MPSYDPAEVCHKWAAAWSQTDPDPSVWTALYTPTAIYIDHAFGIKRTGYAGLANHFQIWRNSMPDFVMIIKHLVPVEQLSDGKCRCGLRTEKRATFVKDLPMNSAMGKAFCFFAVVDLVLQEDRLVESVEEWYTATFERQLGVESYWYKDGAKKTSEVGQGDVRRPGML